MFKHPICHHHYNFHQYNIIIIAISRYEQPNKMQISNERLTTLIRLKPIGRGIIVV